MLNKAGVVVQREIREWFDTSNEQHLLAFLQYERTGRWPDGFPGPEVWFMGEGWQQELRRRVHERPLPAEVTRQLDELERVQAVAGPDFHVEIAAGMLFLKRHGGSHGWHVWENASDSEIGELCKIARHFAR